MDKISDARRFELVELAESSSPLPSDLGSEELEIIKQFRSVIGAISKPLESANPSAIAMAEAVMANERSRVVRCPNLYTYRRGTGCLQREPGIPDRIKMGTASHHREINAGAAKTPRDITANRSRAVDRHPPHAGTGS